MAPEPTLATVFAKEDLTNLIIEEDEKHEGPGWEPVGKADGSSHQTNVLRS